jgi:hypothetical protein
MIAEPLEGVLVSGDTLVLGSADGQGFANYRLEFAPGEQPDAGAWQPVGPNVATPVTDGFLGVWQTGALPPGLYTLRLSVADAGGGEVTAEVRVQVASPATATARTG